jgi:hypothetical protein
MSCEFVMWEHQAGINMLPLMYIYTHESKVCTLVWKHLHYRCPAPHLLLLAAPPSSSLAQGGQLHVGRCILAAALTVLVMGGEGCMYVWMYVLTGPSASCCPTLFLIHSHVQLNPAPLPLPIMNTVNATDTHRAESTLNSFYLEGEQSDRNFHGLAVCAARTCKLFARCFSKL